MGIERFAVHGMASALPSYKVLAALGAMFWSSLLLTSC